VAVVPTFVLGGDQGAVPSGTDSASTDTCGRGRDGRPWPRSRRSSREGIGSRPLRGPTVRARTLVAAVATVVRGGGPDGRRGRGLDWGAAAVVQEEDRGAALVQTQ